MSVFKSLLLTTGVVVMVQLGTVEARAEERAVYASVLSSAGAPVTALTATDFIVSEDGVRREVLRASPADDPLRVAVLVDTSQAIRPHVNDLREALRSFFREMQGRHEIALFEFGDRPHLLVDYTTDPGRLDAGIGRLFARSGSGSYVLDAIVDASRGFRAREGARPVIVVITAEGPEFSQRYHQTVLDEVRKADATLHAFVLQRRRNLLFTDAARERELTLAKASSLTGGRREHLLTSMALKDRLGSLATELKHQYRVVYARPDALVAPEKIDVDVTGSAMMVRAPRVPLTLRALP
ncbi:MAG: VWA domain-containing protein [Vicinamibacterales bacterium]